MPDVHDQPTRSRNMAAIRRRDTKPELIIRSGLHRRGFRFVLDDRRLPGRPDMALKRYNAVIFVHGCFWHGHQCPLFRVPATNSEFWQTKIARNRERDFSASSDLCEAGWRVATVWECALRGRGKLTEDDLFLRLTNWLKDGDRSVLEISGLHAVSPSMQAAETLQPDPAKRHTGF